MAFLKRSIAGSSTIRRTSSAFRSADVIARLNESPLAFLDAI
jgi:hypothetical protein